MTEAGSPFRPVDDEALALARALIAGARHGALGVLDPGTGAPLVTRVALAPAASGGLILLVSDLARHTAALRADPRASVLIGEAAGGGDPMAQPRLTLAGRVVFVPRDGSDRPGLRAAFLAAQPKAALYIDFADFHLARLEPESALLNGGFGRAWNLGPADLAALAGTGPGAGPPG